MAIADTSTAYALDPAVHADAIRELLSEARVLTSHNSPCDVVALVAAGLMRAPDVARVEDSLVTARIAWPDPRTTPNFRPSAALRRRSGARCPW